MSYEETLACTGRMICEIEVEIEVLQLQAKEHRIAGKPPDVRKRQGRIHRCRLQRENSPADTLILDF